MKKKESKSVFLHLYQSKIRCYNREKILFQKNCNCSEFLAPFHTGCAFRKLDGKYERKILSFFPPVTRVHRERADEGMSLLTTLPAVSRKPNRVFPRCCGFVSPTLPPPESPGKRAINMRVSCVYNRAGESFTTSEAL